jgi:hypothetical protein
VLLLSIVTVGIYGLYWHYKTFQEIKNYSGNGTGGGLGLVLAFFCGIIVIFVLPSEVASLYTAEGQKAPNQRGDGAVGAPADPWAVSSGSGRSRAASTTSGSRKAPSNTPLRPRAASGAGPSPILHSPTTT